MSRPHKTRVYDPSFKKCEIEYTKSRVCPAFNESRIAGLEVIIDCKYFQPFVEQICKFANEK